MCLGPRHPALFEVMVMSIGVGVYWFGLAWMDQRSAHLTATWHGISFHFTYHDTPTLANAQGFSRFSEEPTCYRDKSASHQKQNSYMGCFNNNNFILEETCATEL
jgi:hypothetical protein